MDMRRGERIEHGPLLFTIKIPSRKGYAPQRWTGFGRCISFAGNFSFSGKPSFFRQRAQAAPVITGQSCDRYLLPVNELFPCLTFPLWLRPSFIIVPYFYFSVCFFILAFPPLFCLIFIAFSFLFIGKASLGPADDPRNFLIRKYPPAQRREDIRSHNRFTASSA